MSHLDLDALADLLAGEGSAADVAHVGSCSGCAGRLDELATADASVAAALASLPAPAVPADLADRLSAAFAAEPPLTPTSPDWAAPAAAEASPRTVTPFPGASARRPSRAPLAAAAALLVAVGTIGGLSLVGGTAGEDSETSAASGGSAGDTPAALDLPTSSTGQDYAADGALAAALPQLIEGSAAAGRTESLSDEVAEQGDDAAEAPAPAAAAAGDLDRLRDPAELASCLTALLPPEDDAVQPLALDYAAYAGQPALVVVLPATGAPDKVDVFVVGAQCRLGDDRTLFFTRLDRPR